MGNCKCNCTNRREASSQLNYEIGVMMYRAIITKTKDETEYDVTANFIGIIEELNENFIFDESELLCGFENEYQNVNDKYDRQEIQTLFRKALREYTIYLEDDDDVCCY